MASTLVSSYFGRGLAANRPVTLSITTGAIGIWYSTDTNHCYLWNGSAWITLL